MDNKITIIEGPTPLFEPIRENPLVGLHAWTSSVLESPYIYSLATTTVRTFNAQSLLDRCYDTWQDKSTMFLEFRDRIGLTKQVPILAARSVKMNEGEMLILWVRQNLEIEEEEFDQDQLDDDFLDE